MFADTNERRVGFQLSQNPAYDTDEPRLVICYRARSLVGGGGGVASGCSQQLAAAE